MKLWSTVLLALLLAVALFVSECDARKGKKNKGRKQRRRQRTRNKNRDRVLPPQDCGPIPHVDHGSALQTPDDILYACELGFQLQGTNVITCIDGRWTVAPRCVRQVCPPPLRVAFANPPQLSASGTVATYACLSGYRIVNGNGLTSQMINCNLALRQWPALPQCEAVPSLQCGAPPSVNHASNQVSGNMATYTCHSGYKLRAGTLSVISCLNGVWGTTNLAICDSDPSTTTPPPKCLKAPACGGSTIMRGEVADSYDVDSTVKYTCVTGYRLVGQNDNNKKEVDVKCKSDGNWDSVPTCEPVVCGQPTHAIGGNTNPTAAAAVTYNSQYTYTCLNLYETSSATVATCNAAGVWSITPPTCSLKYCPYTALPTLTNGSPYMVTVGANIAVGANVSFQCANNYRIAPSSPTESGVLQYITCQENGTFTAFTYSCVYDDPSSCVDYFTRDGTLTVTTATVTIDTDGAGTAPEQTVTCIRNTNTVCTEVAPTTTMLNGAADCTTATTIILPDVTFVPASPSTETSGVCDELPVTYGSTPAQLTTLFSASQNCQQQVTIDCGANAAATDNNLLGLQLNGQTGTARGGAGSGIGIATGTTMVAGSIPNFIAAFAPCDCGLLATGSCATSCICSRAAISPAGQDTITIPLTGLQPQYVTRIARIGGHRVAAAPVAALVAGEYDVTVGSISCCVNV